MNLLSRNCHGSTEGPHQLLYHLMGHLKAGMIAEFHGKYNSVSENLAKYFPSKRKEQAAPIRHPSLVVCLAANKHIRTGLSPAKQLLQSRSDADPAGPLDIWRPLSDRHESQGTGAALLFQTPDFNSSLSLVHVQILFRNMSNLSLLTATWLWPEKLPGHLQEPIINKSDVVKPWPSAARALVAVCEPETSQYNFSTTHSNSPNFATFQVKLRQGATTLQQHATAFFGVCDWNSSGCRTPVSFFLPPVSASRCLERN